VNEKNDLRQLKIDLSSVELAMTNAYIEHNYYLDLEMGDTILVTDEIRRELERIYEENTDEDVDDVFDIEPFIGRLDIPDWEKEFLRDADRVEREFGTRFIEIPHADSDEGYRDMEDYIDTVKNQRLQDRLTQAINRRRPFRRLKDVLEDYPEELERWFNFSNSRIHERMLEWLKDNGIEPV
jgi:hypothetical protein